ncbi:MAG TPA: hypothetical protein VN370_08740 [Desulfitobacteriaceae bacterium]|nr:hypothetical protein [Desulfitobacteriaceae bacterium]
MGFQRYLGHHATIAITPLLPSMAVANQDIRVLTLAARKALFNSSGGCYFQSSVKS